MLRHDIQAEIKGVRPARTRLKCFMLLRDSVCSMGHLSRVYRRTRVAGHKLYPLASLYYIILYYIIFICYFMYKYFGK